MEKMTPDQALYRARNALTFIRAGKSSMGKDNGYLNPVMVLADCFEVLDGYARKGTLPKEWNRH
jgi:hypothetical protein